MCVVGEFDPILTCSLVYQLIWFQSRFMTKRVQFFHFCAVLSAFGREKYALLIEGSEAVAVKVSQIGIFQNLLICLSLTVVSKFCDCIHAMILTLSGSLVSYLPPS